jgi:hypothetical protein
MPGTPAPALADHRPISRSSSSFNLVHAQLHHGELLGQRGVQKSRGQLTAFIDIIGMPWTPLSYAGVARRSFRRAYWR